MGLFILGVVSLYIAAIPELMYRTEALTFLAFAAALSLMSLVARGNFSFAIFHGLRGLFILIVLRLVGEGRVLVEIALLLPYLLETSMYLNLAKSLAVGSLFTACFIAIDALVLGTPGPEGYFIREGILIYLAVLVGGGGAVLVQYRETIVQKNQRIAALELSMKSLEIANRSFQEYADRIESVTEDNERKRITRDIHDSIGYALTNVGMSLQAAKLYAKDSPNQLNGFLDTIREQVNEALVEARRILHQLRTIQRPQLKGINGIYHLIKSFGEATGVEVTLVTANAPQVYREEIDLAIYYFVQEGLTNAIKHGSANRIEVQFWLFERELEITIMDNGAGIHDLGPGIGHTGMMERFGEFGGRIVMERNDFGFRLRAYIPVGELTYD
jgi:signal transduction histidine kinase